MEIELALVCCIEHTARKKLEFFYISRHTTYECIYITFDSCILKAREQLKSVTGERNGAGTTVRFMHKKPNTGKAEDKTSKDEMNSHIKHSSTLALQSHSFILILKSSFFALGKNNVHKSM